VNEIGRGYGDNGQHAEMGRNDEAKITVNYRDRPKPILSVSAVAETVAETLLKTRIRL